MTSIQYIIQWLFVRPLCCAICLTLLPIGFKNYFFSVRYRGVKTLMINDALTLYQIRFASINAFAENFRLRNMLLILYSTWTGLKQSLH